MKPGPRICREKKTISEMIALFCHQKHNTTGGFLCDDCSTLLDYALNRLKHCPYQEVKPTCGNCISHCYKPAMRERVIKVMRFSGPRMILHHPVLAFFHLLDGCRKR